MAYGRVSRMLDSLSRLVGRGSYGHVAAAVRSADDREVAVKRITGAFDSRRDALCILRARRVLIPP